METSSPRTPRRPLLRVAGAALVALMLVWFQHLAYAHGHAADDGGTAHDHHAVSLWDHAVPDRIVSHEGYDHTGHGHEDGPDPAHRACQLCIVAVSDDDDPGAADEADQPTAFLRTDLYTCVPGTTSAPRLYEDPQSAWAVSATASPRAPPVLI